MTKKLVQSNYYGVWNSCAKEFQFGIKTEKPEQAQKGLSSKLGHDAKKWRFEIKSMNNDNLIRQHNQTQIEKQKNKIDELKRNLCVMEQELEKFIET